VLNRPFNSSNTCRNVERADSFILQIALNIRPSICSWWLGAIRDTGWELKMSYRRTKVVAGAFALLLCASALLSLAVVTGAEPAESRVSPPPLAVAATWAAAASIGDNIYVVGGCQNYVVDFAPTLAKVQIYNVVTGEVSLGAYMPKGVCGAAYGLGPDGKIYVAGGWNATDSSYYQRVQVYDPALNIWNTTAGTIPAPVGRSASAMAANGTLYVFGGGWTSNVTMIYDTATDVWGYGMDQPVTGLDGRAVAYNDTAIIVFGGSYGGTYNGVRIYNPVANTWSTGTSSPIGEAYASAVLARNGYIYLFGGSSTGSASDPSPVATVMRYSPADDAWSTAGTTLSSGRDHAVAVIDCYDRAVVLGGWSGAAAVTTVNAFVTSDIAGHDLIQISMPEDGAIVSGLVAVQVDKVNGVSSFVQIDVYVDGALYETRTAGTSVTFLWDTTALADGSVHTLMARGYNSDGTVEDASVTVTVSSMSVEQQVADIEAKLADLQAQLTVQNANLTALKAQADALQTQLTALQTSTDQSFPALQTQLDDLQSQIDDLKSKADSSGMLSIVILVLVVIVIVLVAMMLLMMRKKP
jgi:N-acetylneuraminic acid mutarotase